MKFPPIKWTCFFLLLLTTNLTLNAQTPGDTFALDIIRTVQIEEKADYRQIEVDQEGNIFLLSPRLHQLHKLLHVADYDSIIKVGGKGIQNEGFINPIKVDVLNRQAVYILDYGNRRIVTLNTNLKVVKDINFLTLEIESIGGNGEDATFFPISFAAGPAGDLFVLNQEDLKIYKINGYQEVETSFAGLAYGAGTLENPDDVQLNPQNLVFVSDTTEQKIIVYDFYGIYQYTLYPKPKFRWKKFRTFEKALICFDDRQLYLLDLITRKGKQYELPLKSPISDIAITRNFLYVLSKKQVTLYKIK